MSSSEDEKPQATEPMDTTPDERSSRKRKTPHDGPTLEIDLSAPEPPSKKALRKMKKEKKEAKKAKKEAKKEKKSKKEGKEDGEDDNQDEDKDEGDAQEKDDEMELKKEKKKAKKSKKAAEEEEDAKVKSKRSNYGVWIGNLAFGTTKADLRAFLTARGGLSPHNITRLHMPEGPRNAAGKPQNKGFAYVDFDKADCVPIVVGLSETDFNGRRVLIKDALSFVGRPEKKEDGNGDKAGSGKPSTRKIFVGNLAYDVNKETLEMHFSKCGTVTHIHVATFEDTGKCKGFAWVEFEDIGSAEAAVRGFVKVPEDDSDEEEEAEEEDSANEDSEDDEKEKKDKKKSKAKEGKKQRMKRVWVNRLFGRPLRMEFAEDPETRYKKRFGKGGKGKGEGNSYDNRSGGGQRDEAAITEENDGATEQRKPERKKKMYNSNRYSEETVHKLTGGIVEATGKKVTFD